MPDETGFAILRPIAGTLAAYEQSDHARKRKDQLMALRRALGSFNPAAYRGTDRDRICQSVDHESHAPWFAKTFPERANELPAMQLALDLEGEPPEPDFNWGLFRREETLHRVHAMLPERGEYERVYLSTVQGDSRHHSLGFDVGYFGGDWFSAIRDAAITPTWHPPDPSAFDQLSTLLSTTNEHCLFDRRDHAETYRAWYAGQDWSERRV